MRWQQIVERLEAKGMTQAANEVLKLREETKQKRGPITRHYSRLTDEKRREILKLHHEVGLTQVQIEARVNINQGDVSKVIRGMV